MGRASSAQLADINLSSGGSPNPTCGNRFLLLQGQGPSCSPWWYHRPGLYHGPKWNHQILISGCSILPLNLQFCLSSLCLHLSVSLPFLHHLLASPTGAQVLWVSGVISGMISVMSCPTCAYGSEQRYCQFIGMPPTQAFKICTGGNLW